MEVGGGGKWTKGIWISGGPYGHYAESVVKQSAVFCKFPQVQ